MLLILILMIIAIVISRIELMLHVERDLTASSLPFKSEETEAHKSETEVEPRF